MISSDKPCDGYRDFSDMLTAYRKSRVLMCAHELGIFESLAYGNHTQEEICEKTGMDLAYGSRFLDVLTHLGFLEQHGNAYGLSRFSVQFLVKGAPSYQGESLAFEKTLTQSWQHLCETVLHGKRVFNIMEKSRDEYLASLRLYLGAMDNAARIRAAELWDRFRPGRKGGVILDAGAGSGAFLVSFLERNMEWTGVFCDLPDVILLAMENPLIRPYLDRISFVEANLLDKSDAPLAVSADLILCSNLIHCQGQDETQSLISKILACLAPGGSLIIHDFFTDHGQRGAMYDLHMMLNTYNGRTYTVGQILSMVEPMGLSHTQVIHFDSSSTALVFTKNHAQP